MIFYIIVFQLQIKREIIFKDYCSYKNLVIVCCFFMANSYIYIYIYIYIYMQSPMGVENSAEGIYACRSHNAKLFERIVHSGIR